MKMWSTAYLVHNHKIIIKLMCVCLKKKTLQAPEKKRNLQHARYDVINTYTCRRTRG